MNGIGEFWEGAGLDISDDGGEVKGEASGVSGADQKKSAAQIRRGQPKMRSRPPNGEGPGPPSFSEFGLERRYRLTQTV